MDERKFFSLSKEDWIFGIVGSGIVVIIIHFFII
ncbi:hypothetical protein UACE39S_00779 [Ureibacillus acetophenoni]